MIALVIRESAEKTWALMLPLPNSNGTENALVVRADNNGNAFWGRFDVTGIPS